MQSTSRCRGSQAWAALLITAGLSVSVASAQSSATSSTGSAGSTSDRTSAAAGTSPSTDSSASSMPSPGSSTGSGTTGSNYGSTSSSSTGSSATAGAGYGATDRAAVSSSSRENTSRSSTLKRADQRFITKAAECSETELAASELAAQRASDPQIRSFAQQITSEHQRMQQELAQLAQRKGVKLDSLDHMGMSRMTTAGGQYSASASARGTGTETGITANSETANISGVANDHGSPRAGAVGATEGMATNPSMNGSSMGEMAMDRHVRHLSRQTGASFDRDYVDLIVDSHEDAVKLFQKAAKDAQDSDVRSYASSHLAGLQAHLDQANTLMKSAAE